MKQWRTFIIMEVVTMAFPMVGIWLNDDQMARILLVIVMFAITCVNVKQFAPKMEGE